METALTGCTMSDKELRELDSIIEDITKEIDNCDDPFKRRILRIVLKLAKASKNHYQTLNAQRS